jgi:uncharacterized protein with GYD domain
MGDVATYLVMFSCGDQEVAQFKDRPARVQKTKDTFRDLGITVKQFFAVLGQEFDAVFIVEAEDFERVATASQALALGCNVRTRTIRAFTENEFGQVLSAVS